MRHLTDYELTDGELLAEVDRIIARGTAESEVGKKTRRPGAYFVKGAQLDDQDDEDSDASPHAKTKAAHHAAMAELYNAIGGQHKKMSAHYKDGAKGAHKDAGEDEDADAAAIKVLQSAGLDTEARLAEAELQRRAVRSCLREPQVGDPSRAGFDKVRRSE